MAVVVTPRLAARRLGAEYRHCRWFEGAEEGCDPVNKCVALVLWTSDYQLAMRDMYDVWRWEGFPVLLRVVER